MAMRDAPHDSREALGQALSDKLEAVARYNAYLQACQDDERALQLLRRLKDADLAYIQLLQDELERQWWQAASREAPRAA
jgi:hypothetical protein